MKGYHISLDCRADNPSLSNISSIYNFLDNLAHELGMTIVSAPHVIKSDGTLIGSVLIKESHLYIHAFPDKNYFFLDVFSCKKFSEDKVISEVLDWFNVEEYCKHSRSRGE